MTDAVLITGDHKYSNASNTAELYLPSSGLSCSLPSLPDYRYSHSVESTGLLCSGENKDYDDHDGNEKSFLDTCLQWRPDTGKWEEALTLSVGRYWHVSWTPSSGIGTYLMGGDDSASWRTTTLIKPDGTQEPGFPLKYRTE